MKHIIVAGIGLGVFLSISAVAKALVMIDSHGRWPATWPQSLDSLRDQARTIEVANGTQENIYEIKFSNRAEFEKAWPTILSLKTSGAPLRLFRVVALKAGDVGELTSNASPIVRIFGPSEGEVSSQSGEKLKASAPWPKNLYGRNGELPEFVRADSAGGKLHWVPVDSKKHDDLAFQERARIDIEVVADGQIIDFNRIALPKATPIEDNRF